MSGVDKETGMKNVTVFFFFSYFAKTLSSQHTSYEGLSKMTVLLVYIFNICLK